MTRRRTLWNAIAARNGFMPGSDEERRFVERHLSIGAATFDSNLSRGFARRHVKALRDLCKSHKLPFDPDDWCPARSRDGSGESSEPIAWAGKPITRVEDFYDRLCSLYDSATNYRVLRVGGTFSRNRTSFSFDEDKPAKDKLAKEPVGPSIRIEYLRKFWNGVRDRSMSGTSVHVVRTLDRLVELWACVELLQKEDLHQANLVYMAPIPSSSIAQEVPAVGMRVVDFDKTLLSLPAPTHGESRYSSWIESDRLASFAWEYIMRVRDLGATDILSTQSPAGLEDIMNRAFTRLKTNEAGAYGRLDEFEKVREIKNRMLEWADQETDKARWLPVIG